MEFKKYLIFVLFLTMILPFDAFGNSVSLCRLGHSFGFLQLDIAEAAGLFDSASLKVRSPIFKSGKDCAEAVRRGDVDAAVLGIDHAITASTIGVSIKQLALLNRVPGWTFVVSKSNRSSINSIKDLENKNIGVSSPGSATHILTNYLFHKNGIPSGKYKPVRAGTKTLPDIMMKGGIDAGMALEPYGSRLVQEQGADILHDFRTITGTEESIGSLYPMTSLLVRQDFIDSDRETVQALVQAIVTASVWLGNSSTQDVIDLLPKQVVTNPDEWSMSFSNSREVFSPDGKPDTRGFSTVLEANQVFGSLPTDREFPVTDFIDLEFWKLADKSYVDLSSMSSNPAEDTTKQRKHTTYLLVLGGLVFLVLVFLFTRKRLINK